MKNTFKIILSLFILSGIIVTSCVKDEFDQPDIPNPCLISSGLHPTSGLSVQKLLELYPSFEILDADGEVRKFPVDSNYVFKGVVISSDQQGNFYKSMYIQDETGGIMLSIDASNLFNEYKVGQTVHIRLSGLTCHYQTGDFKTSMLEIGFGQFTDSHGQKIGRIPATVLSNYMKNQSCPKTVTPIDINLSSTPVPNTYIGRLVRINDVEFIDSELDSTYALKNKTSNRHITDCDGNKIIVRNSGYANFASLQLPQGNGSIVGVYAKYGDDIQLMIRDTTDVKFYNTRCDGDGGGGTGNGSGTFDDPYDIEAGISNQGKASVWVQGFITGIVDVTTDPDNFAKDLTAPFASNSNIYIAPTADETDTTKMLIVQLPSGDVRSETNLVDNEALLGKEIKYHGNLEAYFGTEGMKGTDGYWLIETNTGIDPDAPVVYEVLGTSEVVNSLSEDFENGTAGDDWKLNGWLNANKVGSSYWLTSEYNDNKYAQMKGYNATSDNLETWLVTPGVDLTTAKKLSFETKVGYWKHAGLTIHVSTDFDGNKDNLLTATWIDITDQATIPTTPTDGYGDSFEPSGDIDLSSYSGTIYVLFKYTGDNSDNTTTFQIDNVQIVDL